MKYLSIILLIAITFVGCSSFKVEEKQNKIKQDHTTVSTDRIELKEAIPFDLSTLYMRLFSLKMEKQNKFVLGFYYFGKKEAQFEKINLKFGNEVHELLPRIPSETEDFGALGIAEEFYVRVPNGLIDNLISSQKVELDVIGKGFSYNKILDKKNKKNIEKFLNHKTVLAYKN
ncbi:MAG: hypothetical protein JEY94_15425 [Melioribacteraceae bacterium]|nr:hypothetical protein [Melioribacteraceae bacterium]